MSRRQQQYSRDSRDSRESELMKRAARDPEVYDEMIKSMEEDPDLVEIFTKHLQKNIGEDKWRKMSVEQQNILIKNVMEKNRIPVRKNGGKRVKRNTRRKTVKRKTVKRKTTKRKTVRRKKMHNRKFITKRR